MEDAARPLFHGRSGKGRMAATPGNLTDNAYRASDLRDTGVRILLASAWPPFNLRPGLGNTQQAIHQLLKLRTFPDRASGYVIASDAATLRKVLHSELVGLYPGVEGAEGVHTVEDVDRYYAAGARSLGIVHFFDNEIGTGVPGQVKAILGSKPAPQPTEGLSPFGREVVKRMITLGMTIDVAHSSDATIRDVLDLTETAGVPIIYSHGGVRELNSKARNLPEDLAVRIAKGGGMIGVSIFGPLFTDAPPAFEGAVPGTCDDIITHWQRWTKVVGADHLAFGTDLNGFAVRPKKGGSCPNGFRNSSDFLTFSEALAAHGVPREALDGMGEHFVQLVEQVEAKADPAARAKAARLHVDDANFFDVAM